MAILYLLLVCCLIFTVEPAAREKFRKCDQTDFCRRQRHHKSIPRIIDPNSIQLNSSGFFATLYAPENPKDVPLQLSITRVVDNIGMYTNMCNTHHKIYRIVIIFCFFQKFLDDSFLDVFFWFYTVRVHITEHKSVAWRPRYLIESDVLSSNGRTPLGVKVGDDKNPNKGEFEWGVDGLKYTIIVYYQPFRVEFLLNNKLHILVNNQNLLHFEAYKHKVSKISLL